MLNLFYRNTNIGNIQGFICHNTNIVDIKDCICLFVYLFRYQGFYFS